MSPLPITEHFYVFENTEPRFKSYQSYWEF